MGHSRELLESIAVNLRLSYPEPEHRFVYERGLHETDHRNQPDIQVYCAGKLLCVVEIGYTRPEKLKLYVESDIPDVRWYSKDGRLMALPRFGPQLPLVREIKYAWDSRDVWYRSGGPYGDACWELSAAAWPLYERIAEFPQLPLRRSVIRNLIRLYHDNPGVEVMGDHEMMVRMIYDDVLPVKPGERIVAWCEMEEGCSDVMTDFWSNGVYLVAYQYCDYCGAERVVYDQHELQDMLGVPYDFRDFQLDAARANQDLGRCGMVPYEPVPTTELVASFREAHGLELDLGAIVEWDYFAPRHGAGVAG